MPRGILFHHYTYDDGNCVCGQLHHPDQPELDSNVNADMQALVPQILDRPEEEIRLLLEMLVRAYDPCISCSTHLP